MAMRGTRVCWLLAALLGALPASRPAFAQPSPGRSASIAAERPAPIAPQAPATEPAVGSRPALKASFAPPTADPAPSNPVDRQAARPLPSTDLDRKLEPVAPARSVGEGVANAVHTVIGDFPAGKTISVFFDASVNLPFPAGVTVVSNQGTISGINFGGELTDDPDAPGATDPTVTPVLAMPLLAGATKTVADPAPGNGDGMAQAGEAITYTVTVTNNGNGGDLDVQVLDTVPAGTTLDLGSIQAVLSGGAAGVTDASAGNIVDVTIASMPGAGSQAVVTFRVTVDSPVAAGVEMLSNTAQISSQLVSQFDTTQADIPIDAVPAFTMTKDDGGVTVDPETTVVYTLSWSNDGTQDASNVVLEDTVPVGSLFDAGASDPSWSCGDGDPEGTLCTLDVGTVAGAGGSGSVPFAVEVVAPQDAPPTIDNTASMHDDGAGSGGVPVTAEGSDSTPVNDLLPPTVESIDTLKRSGGGEVEECESVAALVSGFEVVFSEAMEPASVVDAANWQVVAAGPDLDLSTEECGPAIGDDVLMPIDQVLYDGSTTSAQVRLDLQDFLDNGPYRVMACSGAGGLADMAGNELDGDGDFSGGDDFVRYFRIDKLDQFVNGHLDCSLDGWTTVAGGGSTIVHEPLMDMDDAAISGSAHFTNAAGSTQLAMGQCVEVDGTAIYAFDGFVYLDTPGITLAVIRTCEFFAAAACSGPGMPAQAFFSSVSTDSVWIGFTGGVVAPQTAGSAMCQVTLRNGAGLAYEAFLDDLSFDLLQSPILFEDGFESGDTSEWSHVVP
jgi:uncharacterized repeat protein (TIGR01451 family)